MNNIALFIDFENFADHRYLDVGRLIADLRERGRVLVRRAYADWGRYAPAER